MIDQVVENIQQIEELKREIVSKIQSLQEENFKYLDSSSLQEIISAENEIDVLFEVTNQHFKDSFKPQSSSLQNNDFMSLKKLKNDFEASENHYRKVVKPLIEKTKKSAPKSIQTVEQKKKKQAFLPSLGNEFTNESDKVPPSQNLTTSVNKNVATSQPSQNQTASANKNAATSQQSSKNFASDDFKVVFMEDQQKQKLLQEKPASKNEKSKIETGAKQELLKIEQDLDTMVQISQDINSTVDSHDQKIEKIEEHIDNSLDHAKKATVDLKKASMYALGGVIVAGVAGAGLGALVGGPIGAGLGLYGGLTGAGAVAATVGVGAGVGAVGGSAMGVVGRKLMHYVNTAGVTNLLSRNRKRSNSTKKEGDSDGSASDSEVMMVRSPSDSNLKEIEEKMKKMDGALTFKSGFKTEKKIEEGSKSMINLPQPSPSTSNPPKKKEKIERKKEENEVDMF